MIQTDLNTIFVRRKKKHHWNVAAQYTHLLRISSCVVGEITLVFNQFTKVYFAVPYVVYRFVNSIFGCVQSNQFHLWFVLVFTKEAFNKTSTIQHIMWYQPFAILYFQLTLSLSVSMCCYTRRCICQKQNYNEEKVERMN